MESFTMTTTIDAETFSNLEFLAGNTSCSASELAAEAIRIYIEDQSWQTEAIKEGIRQADAGNFASADKVKSMFSKWGVNV
ncbi:hypothetical protein QUF72_17905 [Desulfobacterales bacterium HSG2]|nr:hypothetical protein [Desulfobacterales bacterium HSG2]